MKDSKGRTYDAWILKHRNGHFIMHTFRQRRVDAWKAPTLSRAKLRRMGIRAVKVRLLEVLE